MFMYNEQVYTSLRDSEMIITVLVSLDPNRYLIGIDYVDVRLR